MALVANEAASSVVLAAAVQSGQLSSWQTTTKANTLVACWLAGTD